MKPNCSCCQQMAVDLRGCCRRTDYYPAGGAVEVVDNLEGSGDFCDGFGRWSDEKADRVREQREPVAESTTTEPDAESVDDGESWEVAGGQSETAECVAAAVEEYAAYNWEDTEERLAARTAAVTAALERAAETDGAVGRSDIEDLVEQYPVSGQNEDTWWRKNVRPILSEYGEYDNAEQGYQVDALS